MAPKKPSRIATHTRVTHEGSLGEFRNFLSRRTGGVVAPSKGPSSREAGYQQADSRESSVESRGSHDGGAAAQAPVSPPPSPSSGAHTAQSSEPSYHFRTSKSDSFIFDPRAAQEDTLDQPLSSNPLLRKTVNAHWFVKQAPLFPSGSPAEGSPTAGSVFPSAFQSSQQKKKLEAAAVKEIHAEKELQSAKRDKQKKQREIREREKAYYDAAGLESFLVTEGEEQRFIIRAAGQDADSFFAEFAKNKRSFTTFYKVWKAIAEALSAVHAKGWVHRDVKLEHILIQEQDGQFIVHFVGAKYAAQIKDNFDFIHPDYTSVDACQAPELTRGNGQGWTKVHPKPDQDAHSFSQAFTAAARMTGFHEHLPEGLQTLLAAALDNDPLKRPALSEFVAELSNTPVERFASPPEESQDAARGSQEETKRRDSENIVSGERSGYRSSSACVDAPGSVRESSIFVSNQDAAEATIKDVFKKGLNLELDGSKATGFARNETARACMLAAASHFEHVRRERGCNPFALMARPWDHQGEQDLKVYLKALHDGANYTDETRRFLTGQCSSKDSNYVYHTPTQKRSGSRFKFFDSAIQELKIQINEKRSLKRFVYRTGTQTVMGLLFVASVVALALFVAGTHGAGALLIPGLKWLAHSWGANIGALALTGAALTPAGITAGCLSTRARFAP